MFREKTRLYKVYHIRIKGNTDLSEGYVGITRRSLPYRLSQHFCSKRPVGKILRALGHQAVEIVQLAMLPKEQALEMEYNLRPKRFIGWNVFAGGNRITVVCTLCGKPLPKRKTGAMCMDCHPTKFVKGRTPHNFGKGKKYRLTSPTGESFEPESLTRFCREHGILDTNIRKIAKGKRKSDHGWTAVCIEY